MKKDTNGTIEAVKQAVNAGTGFSIIPAYRTAKGANLIGHAHTPDARLNDNHHLELDLTQEQEPYSC